MNLLALFADISAHNWPALILLIAVYLRTVLSPSSKYLATLSPNWRPLPVALAGCAITVVTALQSGSVPLTAAIAGFVGLVAAGFFDGLIAAIFGAPANAPSWAKILVGLIDDAGAASGGATPPAPSAPSAPSAAAKTAAGALSMLAIVLGLGACTAAQNAVNAITPGLVFAECVVADYEKQPAGTPIATVIADEIETCGGDALSVVNVLDLHEAPAVHASVAHGGK